MAIFTTDSGSTCTMGPTSRQVDFEGTADFLTVLAHHGYNYTYCYGFEIFGNALFEKNALLYFHSGGGC